MQGSMPWFVKTRWRDIQMNYEYIGFEHTFRECNFAADNMAKRGRNLGNGAGLEYVGRPCFLTSIEFPNVSYFRFK